MSDRPSDGMGLDELREEFDWISEFQSRMAERICGDADVHNLVDYVGKLERENAKLRDENARLRSCLSDDAENARMIMGENDKLRTQLADVTESMGRVEERCAKLRDVVTELYSCSRQTGCDPCGYKDVCGMSDRMRELGVEVDG